MSARADSYLRLRHTYVATSIGEYIAVHEQVYAVHTSANMDVGCACTPAI